MSETPKCRKLGCTMKCWADGRPDEPCWGNLGVSEDYPGMYLHFCEGHGHPEDKQGYKPNSPTISLGPDPVVIE